MLVGGLSPNSSTGRRALFMCRILTYTRYRYRRIGIRKSSLTKSLCRRSTWLAILYSYARRMIIMIGLPRLVSSLWSCFVGMGNWNKPISAVPPHAENAYLNRIFILLYKMYANMYVNVIVINSWRIPHYASIAVIVFTIIRGKTRERWINKKKK